jgi:hypothetical protein
MRRRLRWMLLAFLVTAGSVRADGPIGGLREPDFENTDPHINVMAGLGLSAFVLFGGVWLIRHPRGRRVYGVVVGLVFAGVGCYFMPGHFLPAELLFLLLGLIPFGWGCYGLLSVKELLIGRNLLFLVLAVAGATVTVVALNQMKWKVPEWVQDRWRDRAKERERLRQEASPSLPAEKADASSKPSL